MVEKLTSSFGDQLWSSEEHVLFCGKGFHKACLMQVHCMMNKLLGLIKMISLMLSIFHPLIAKSRLFADNASVDAQLKKGGKGNSLTPIRVPRYCTQGKHC